MKMNRWIVLAVCVAVCACKCPARDNKGGEAGPKERPRSIENETGDIDPLWMANNKSAIKDIGLTNEQIDTMKKLRFDMRRELIEIEAVKERAALAQAELLSNEKPDESAVLKAVDNVFSAQNQIARIKMKYLLKVREIMTSEQRDKAREIMRQKRSMQGLRGDHTKKNRDMRGKTDEKNVLPAIANPPPPADVKVETK